MFDVEGFYIVYRFESNRLAIAPVRAHVVYGKSAANRLFHAVNTRETVLLWYHLVRTILGRLEVQARSPVVTEVFREGARSAGGGRGRVHGSVIHLPAIVSDMRIFNHPWEEAPCTLALNEFPPTIW